MAVHLYAATAPMTDRYFVDSDGELLFVPQQGTLVLHTELGPLQLAPGEIAVIPRGIRFRVDLPGGPARGYLCENYGAPFTLPERGPIGANGLASERDFLAPTAAYEDRGGPVEVVQKFGGNLWAADYDHSPLDVVAWHGSYVPVKYDTANFMVLRHGQLRPPGPVHLHRAHLAVRATRAWPTWTSSSSRRAGWSARTRSGRPGSTATSCPSSWAWCTARTTPRPRGSCPAGPACTTRSTRTGRTLETFTRASEAELAPQKVTGSLAFMFESRWMIIPTRQAMEAAHRQPDYDAVWAGLPRRFGAGQ